jgi:hypothetical protein
LVDPWAIGGMASIDASSIRNVMPIVKINNEHTAAV